MVDAMLGRVLKALDEAAKYSLERQAFGVPLVKHQAVAHMLADMAVGRTTLKADELADHHSCRLGKWYYGDGSLGMRGHRAFAPLEKPHALVHEHGKRAARAFESGDLAGALKEIALVEQASVEVLRLLDDLGR